MTQEIRNNKLVITGKSGNDLYTPLSAFEMPVRKAPLITKNNSPVGIDMGKIIPGQSPVAINWLHFAADKYNISPNIKDYVFAYVPALTSDIPNRNLQGFSLPSLLEFSTDYGCQHYKTFVGKGLYVEHQNQEPLNASGVILDASILPVPRYKVAKVMLLVACDRTKNPTVASRILHDGGSFSMGCMTGALQCSICGGVLGPSVKTRTCTCYHTDWKNMAGYGKVYDKKLHYLTALQPAFFEISWVASPADITAYGDLI